MTFLPYEQRKAETAQLLQELHETHSMDEHPQSNKFILHYEQVWTKCEEEDHVEILGVEEDELETAIIMHEVEGTPSEYGTPGEYEQEGDRAEIQMTESAWERAANQSEISEDIKKHMMAFGDMDGGAKIAQLAVSKGLRSMCQQQQATEVELVLVVPSTSEKWAIQPNQDTTGTMIVSRPYVSSVPHRRVKNDVIVKEARDNDEVIEQATRFKRQTMHGTAKNRTHAPIITEGTAQKGGYAAIFTFVEAVIWTMHCDVKEANGDHSVIDLLVNTREMEEEFRGCYIATRGEPMGSLLRWRANINETLYGTRRGDPARLINVRRTLHTGWKEPQPPYG